MRYLSRNTSFFKFIFTYTEIVDRKIAPGYDWLNLPSYQEYSLHQFCLPPRLEDLSELRELSNFEGNFDNAAGEEVD